MKRESNIKKRNKNLTVSDSAESLWIENTIRFSKTEVMANFEKTLIKIKDDENKYIPRLKVPRYYYVHFHYQHYCYY